MHCIIIDVSYYLLCIRLAFLQIILYFIRMWAPERKLMPMHK